MSTRTDTASRVLPGGQRKTTLTPVEELRITLADVRDPESLQRILHRFLRSHHETSRAFRSSSRLRAVTFEGLVFTAGADLPPIQHGFGITVRYAPVRWKGATAATACQYSETTNDGVNLVLHAITSGVADVEVWPVG